ncbi:hypothetical protein EYC84_004847 [Monilinia fructicola]|nr:hypothetical protein EYC84_004847 [Monilinia fructicola]
MPMQTQMQNIHTNPVTGLHTGPGGEPLNQGQADMVERWRQRRDGFKRLGTDGFIDRYTWKQAFTIGVSHYLNLNWTRGDARIPLDRRDARYTFSLNRPPLVNPMPDSEG